MTNPLLAAGQLPAFSQIRPEHVEPALDEMLARNRRTIAGLLQGTGDFTWQSLLDPLETINDDLNRLWSPVRHLHSVADTEPLRSAYSACLPKLSDYATEIGQNETLYAAYRQVADSATFATLTAAQRKIIENELRDFRLSGVALSGPAKARFKAIRQQLSQLQTQFEEHVLDATQAWKKRVTDAQEVAGIPDSALGLAKQTAVRNNQDGWLFTLDAPLYVPVLTYADNRALRREMYEAYVTRASDQGPLSGQFDNSATMTDILQLRYEQACLVGFSNYAELSLATKMAKSTDQVLRFLQDLAAKARPVALQEFAEIRNFARDLDGVEKLEAWDVAYYSEKLRQHRYNISQEQLRQYFPVQRTVAGLFKVVELLYGLRIQAKSDVDVWHPDVSFYEIFDSQNVVRGSFFLDLYAREGKRGGAWMDECVVRRRTGSRTQLPVAYLTCNFMPPVNGRQSLLSHDEVITLFHEFGHGLHHMLTLVDYAGVSGIHGVAWDAVELPSQFMENWCWEKEALSFISGHHETGVPIDDELLERMLAAKNFQVGMQTVRQLEFALFDFHLHMQTSPMDAAAIQRLLDKVRSEVAVVQPPACNRFQNSFSHIFAGGYAAGYYSYKWAEVLAADAYSRFEETGIFDPDVGRQFLHSILEQGGSRDAMALFVEFRGREPSVDPLLRKAGMSA